MERAVLTASTHTFLRCRRSHLTLALSCWRGRCSQPGDQRPDFHDHLLWHPNLGHLEHDVAAVADDLRAELNHLLAQTRPKSPPYPGNGGLYLSRERPVSADAVEKVRFEVVAAAGFGSRGVAGDRRDPSRRWDRRQRRDQHGELAEVLGGGGEKELVTSAVRPA